MSRASTIIRSIAKYNLQRTPKLLHSMSVQFHRASSIINTKFEQNQNSPFDEEPREDSHEILDIYKERLKQSQLSEQDSFEEEEDRKLANLNLIHGVTGVFDIEDLVETLHYQQAEDLFVAAVPREFKYVDYIVVVTGRSRRHMQAIAQLVKRIFKQKRYKTDILPKIEGESSEDWMAMDLGNIALHIFSQKARTIYDLDSLWAVGSKYDEESNKQEPVSTLLENQSFSLKGLEPAN